MDAAGLGRADNGAQVVGIFDLIAQDEEGRLPPLLGQPQHVLHLTVGVGGGQQGHPLVGDAAAEKVQLLGGDLFYETPPLPAFGDNRRERPAGRPMGHQQAVDFPAGPQGLRHGVPSGYHIGSRRFIVVKIAVLLHKGQGLP